MALTFKCGMNKPWLFRICIEESYDKSYVSDYHLYILSSQLVIRVHLSDESSKTMMVDERQTVRQVRVSLIQFK